MTAQADSSDKHDKPQSHPRPAMPSGTVRARRIHTRYRKGKARPEQNLEPAAPNPDLMPNADNTASRPRPSDSKRSKALAQQSQHSQPPSISTQSTSQSQPIQPVQPVSKTPTAPAHPQNPSTVSKGSVQHHQHSSAPKNSQPSATVPPHVDTQHPLVPRHTTTSLSPPTPTSSRKADSPRLAATQPLKPIHNQLNQQQAQSSAKSPRLIVDISPVKSQYSAAAVQDPDETENTPPASMSTEDSSSDDSKRADDHEQIELEQLRACVARLRPGKDAGRARPLICQDITNSHADTLRISRLPHGVTYDRLLCMVEPFGDVEELVWTSSDPYVCDVIYKDSAAAREAKHFLGDALVGNDSEPPLKAELRSRDPGAQLFVGDLTPDVTEEMLEATFTELVGEPVSALLKRDPDSFSPIGYGFLSFQSESSANFALVAGHRIKVGNACVRVGRAERNTYLYVSDLSPDVSANELKNAFDKFGSLVEEDTVIIRRSYAIVRYKNRAAAEKAKRTLDKTDLKGRLSVRYAEAEPLKACVAVQFHSSVPRPPNSLRDLLSATFSKYGNCSVEIPRLQNGMWRKVAFVTFHGEPIAANLAALETVQSIRFVSSLPVCCQFARELIPRLPSRGMYQEKLAGGEATCTNSALVPDRVTARNFFARKNPSRRTDPGSENGNGRPGRQPFEQRMGQFGDENNTAPRGPDFVPVYVPISALQHPSNLNGSAAPSSEGEFAGYQQLWQSRAMMGQGNAASSNIHANPSHYSRSYTSFAPAQDRVMRW